MSQSCADVGPSGHDRPPMGDRGHLKIGATLAVLGGFGYFTTLLLHGDLPDHTTELALQHIAARPEWRALKLALIVSVLLWVAAFAIIARSLSTSNSRMLGRLAVTFIAIGAVLPVVEYAVIGYELKAVADTWEIVSEPERQHQVFLADALLGVTGGLFRSVIAWLYGLPFVMMGLAVALGRDYPRALGWIAVAAGSGALFTGATMFLGVDLVPMPVLYGGFVAPLTLWLVLIGVLTWRRPGSVVPTG